VERSNIHWLKTHTFAGPGIAWLLFSSVVLAQGPTKVRTELQPAPGVTDVNGRNGTATTIHVNSDLVLIPVAVTDHKGRFVNSLAKEHFSVYENKVEQEITHFAAEDAPVSICIVVDTSASMRLKLPKAREAVSALLNGANPDDEFCLVQFNQRPELLLSLTKQRSAVQDKMDHLLVEGATALLDAVFVAMHEMKGAQYTRKAVIIISDGEDNASRHSMSDLQQAAREADLQIYAIGILDPHGFSTGKHDGSDGPALMKSITEESGGRLYKVSNLGQLADITSKIGAALRNEYVLGYSPRDHERNGAYRRVQVLLHPPKGWSRLLVFWRRGYYAPSQ
jgi:VWFA-related protein